MAEFPFDVGADFEAVVDGTDAVTVESIDPDTGEATATAYPVAALRSREAAGEGAAGGGTVGAAQRDFTLVASGLGFVPKARDRVTLGTVAYRVGTVTVAAFGALYRCEGCVRQR